MGRKFPRKGEQPGINCYGPETSEWNRTCITIKTVGRYNDTELLGKGPIIHKNLFAEFSNLFSALPNKTECISMSGFWPGGAPDDAYATLIGKANQSGKKTFSECTGAQLRNALYKIRLRCISMKRRARI